MECTQFVDVDEERIVGDVRIETMQAGRRIAGTASAGAVETPSVAGTDELPRDHLAIGKQAALVRAQTLEHRHRARVAHRDQRRAVGVERQRHVIRQLGQAGDTEP